MKCPAAGQGCGELAGGTRGKRGAGRRMVLRRSGRRRRPFLCRHRQCGPLPLLLAPQPGRLAVAAAESRGEGIGRCVAGTFSDLRERRLTGAQVISRQRHAPVGQILHRGLAECALEASREGRPRQPADGCQFRDRPRVGGIVVDGLQSRSQSRIGRSLEPARGTAARPEARADSEDQENVEEPVEYGLLAGLRGGQFPRQYSDDIVHGIADGRGERQDLGQRAEQPFSDVTGKSIGAAQEHRGPPVIGVIVVSMPRPELRGLEAGGRRLMGDVVVEPTPHERQLAGRQFESRLGVVEPEPCASLDDGVQRELDGPRQPQPPGGRGHRPGKDTARRARPRQVVLQEVHLTSVCRSRLDRQGD